MVISLEWIGINPMYHVLEHAQLAHITDISVENIEQKVHDYIGLLHSQRVHQC